MPNLTLVWCLWVFEQFQALISLRPQASAEDEEKTKAVLADMQTAEAGQSLPQTAPEQRRPTSMLRRALSMLKRSKSPPPPESILSSAVGFYAAQATMLAAAIIGEVHYCSTP